MGRGVIAFLALVFTAIAVVPSSAHLFALPNKIGMTEAQYFIAQSIYRGWALFGLVVIPGLLIDVALAFVLRRERLPFCFAASACVLLAASLAVFFAYTYPANVATDNWVKSPANWAALREQWEYSHAANAAITFAAFCFVALANVTRRA